MKSNSARKLRVIRCLDGGCHKMLRLPDIVFRHLFPVANTIARLFARNQNTADFKSSELYRVILSPLSEKSHVGLVDYTIVEEIITIIIRDDSCSVELNCRRIAIA